MHDDRSLVESRLKRVLASAPPRGATPAVPLAVAVWHAPGEPVPVAEGLAAEPSPTRSGAQWGAPWGTSWFRVTGTVPAEWAGRTVEAILDLGFDENMPGFQCEGLVYRPDGTPVKGLNPRNQWVRIGAPVEGGEGSGATSKPRRTRSSSTTTPSCRRSWATGDAGSDPQYRLTRMDLAVFEETVWQLVLDLEVLGELMPELPADSARRWEILRAVDRALDAVDLQDVKGTAAAARACLEGVLASPRPAVRAPHQRRRPRPHRLRVAVAAARDRAQGRAYDVQRDGAAGGRARLRLRHVAGPAVGVDQGPPARDVGG